MKKIKLMGLALLCIIVTPFSIVAADFDGSKPLLCATIETFECGSGIECRRGTAQSVNLPQFLKIDFREKKVSGTRESGEVLTAKIETMERSDGKVLLQGTQNNKGWSMFINEATGKMTITASDDQAGFVVFGACTNP
ncbi:MAG: hypothetical protein PVH36_08015 [Desulfobacterales bacterium]